MFVILLRGPGGGALVAGECGYGRRGRAFALRVVAVVERVGARLVLWYTAVCIIRVRITNICF